MIVQEKVTGYSDPYKSLHFIIPLFGKMVKPDKYIYTIGRASIPTSCHQFGNCFFNGFTLQVYIYITETAAALFRK